MAKNNKQHIPTITTDEVVLEGKNNTTTAKLSFEEDQFSVKNATTGEDLLKVNSLSGEVFVGSGLVLPDGTALNSVNDVTIKDFEIRLSSPVVIYKNEETPSNDEPIVVQAVLTNLDIEET